MRPCLILPACHLFGGAAGLWLLHPDLLALVTASQSMHHGWANLRYGGPNHLGLWSNAGRRREASQARFIGALPPGTPNQLTSLGASVHELL